MLKLSLQSVYRDMATRGSGGFMRAMPGCSVDDLITLLEFSSIKI